MARFIDVTGKAKKLPEACSPFISRDGDKWHVEFKDGTKRVFKHVYDGLSELCEMINLDDVHDIYDV